MIRKDGVTRDVTEEREAEEDLRRSLKELSDLKFALDESAIVAFTDQRGKVTYVNDRFSAGVVSLRLCVSQGTVVARIGRR